MGPMTEAIRPSRPLLRDPLSLLGVFLLALSLHVATAWLVSQRVEMGLLRLGAFFDAAIYIEIAKSFPLPYAAEGTHYQGHAPGYPALIAAFRALTPRAFLHWGALALLASWLPASLAAVAFFLLCRELDLEPRWPTLAFVLLNPRWLSVASTVHAESLAMLLVLAAAIAHLRGQLGWEVAWLAVAGVTRYPALLVGAALAYGVLVQQRRVALRSFALLSVPLLGFGLLNLYLYLHIPGFGGMAAAHSVLWDTYLTWPFHAVFDNAVRWWVAEQPVPGFALTNLTLLFSLVSVALALRGGDREDHFLGLWVGVTVLFHVCLAGEWGGYDFPRLALLAWPAALLIVWRRLLAARPLLLRAAAILGLGVLSLVATVDIVADAARWQWASYPMPAHTVRGFRIDTPRWIDFEALYEKPARRAQKGRAEGR